MQSGYKIVFALVRFIYKCFSEGLVFLTCTVLGIFNNDFRRRAGKIWQNTEHKYHVITGSISIVMLSIWVLASISSGKFGKSSGDGSVRISPPTAKSEDGKTLFTTSAEDNDRFSSPSPEQIEKVRTLVRNQLKSELNEFYREKDGKLYAVGWNHYQLIHDQKNEKIAISPIELSYYDIERGIIEKYDIEITDAVAFKAKPRIKRTHRHDDLKKYSENKKNSQNQIAEDDYPYLKPWTDLIPITLKTRVVRTKDERLMLESQFFRLLSAYSDRDFSKLLNENQESFLSEVGAKALKEVEDSFEIISHQKDGSIFLAGMGSHDENEALGGHVSYKQFGFIPNTSVDLAFEEGLSINLYRLYEEPLMLILEWRGGHQFWVTEYEVSELDRINGVIGRGVVHTVIRGNRRSAGITVKPADNGAAAVTKLHKGWSDWMPTNEILLFHMYETRKDKGTKWQFDWMYYHLNRPVPQSSYPRDVSKPFADFRMKSQYFERALKTSRYEPMNLPPERLDDFAKMMETHFPQGLR